VETPTISGQFRQYLALQLTNYASGARKNDVFSRMREIASKLTDEEVRLLSGFYGEQ
jgi:cytochrome c553